MWKLSLSNFCDVNFDPFLWQILDGIKGIADQVDEGLRDLNRSCLKGDIFFTGDSDVDLVHLQIFSTKIQCFRNNIFSSARYVGIIFSVSGISAKSADNFEIR